MSGTRPARPGAGHPSDGRDDAQALLRSVSRRLITGIAVLTVQHDDLVHGATVSTTSVVSQHPLSLAVSLRRGSWFAQVVLAGGTFSVNVLGAAQVRLARWFARSDRPSGSRQFDAVDWSPDPQTGAPLLRGALAQLRCTLVNNVPVGEDVVLIAEVVDGLAGIGTPLAGFDGLLYDVALNEVPDAPPTVAPQG